MNALNLATKLALLGLMVAQTPNAYCEGDLDYGFAYGGNTYAPIPYLVNSQASTISFSSCVGEDAAVQANGKILVAGTCDLQANGYQYNGVASMMRLNADGTLDTSFGNSPWPSAQAYPGVPGYQFLAAGSYFIGGQISLALRPDGRIVVGGTIADGTRFGAQSLAIAQLTSNGSYDAGFGTGGISIQHFSQSLDDDNQLSRIALDAGGNIAIAGTYFQHKAGTTANTDFLAGRIAADGTSAQLQKFAFDIGGTLADTAKDVAVDSQGRYVIAGSVTPANTALECGVIRIDAATVQLDASFGTQGKQTLSFDTGGFNDDCVSLAMRNDDSILMAANVAGSGVGVALLAASGQLDASFGLKLVSSMGSAWHLASVDRIGLQPWDGRIVLVGETLPTGSCDFCAYDFDIVRLNPEGILDTSFVASTPGSDSGSVLVDFGIERNQYSGGYFTWDHAHAAAFHGHELIVVGESTAFSTNQSYTPQTRFAVTQLSTEDIFRASFDSPPTGIACRAASVSPSGFAAVLAHELDGRPLCIPPVTFNLSGYGSVTACATSMCDAQNPGCPTTLRTPQAGAAQFSVDSSAAVPKATVDISSMPGQLDTFDAPIQYSLFGFGQSCTSTFSNTAFVVTGSLDVQTDHQWGGFPYAVDSVQVDGFSTSASGCDAALINTFLPYYEPSVTQYLQGAVTALLPATYAGTDVCQL